MLECHQGPNYPLPIQLHEFPLDTGDIGLEQNKMILIIGFIELRKVENKIVPEYNITRNKDNNLINSQFNISLTLTQ